MSDELRLAGYREPLGLWVRGEVRLETDPELRVQEFEFSSRGDRVPGRLLRPGAGGAPLPLVLLEHGSDDAADSDVLLAAGSAWARHGVAVASVDLPLRGARADRKLADRLPDPGDPTPSPARSALAVELARQAVIDLERALDALASLEWVDAERTVFVGLRLGAVLGAPFCALDPRPRAVVLALGGGGLGPAEIDPARYVGRIAPRPLLLVEASHDAQVSRASAEALFAAAGSRKQQLWIDAPAPALTGAALRALWEFVAHQLGVAGGRPA